jgi:CelD/BcsL family acetyltransferase involved in cellulose biosynthesis
MDRALEERDKLKISVVRPGELGPDEIAVWLSMQRQTPALANPFLCPDFTLAVGALRPCARVAVLHDGPHLAGFFPFERRGLSGGVPIGHGLNQRQGLIHAPGAEWDPKALLRACRLSAWQFDNLVAGQHPLGRFATAAVPVAVVDLAHGFAHYEKELQQKTGKFYRELNRKTRRLEEEVGKIHFVADSRDKAALNRLVDWKSEQLRQKGALDIFTRPWITSLLDLLFSMKADHFSMPLSVLYAGDTPVASTVNLRSGDLLVGWHCAYDPRFAHYSPGLMQYIAMFRDAAVAGVRRIDMGTGTETFKRTLKTHDEFVAVGTAAANPAAGAAHRARAAATLWVRGQVKRYPPLFRAADLVLRQTGRIG